MASCVLGYKLSFDESEAQCVFLHICLHDIICLLRSFLCDDLCRGSGQVVKVSPMLPKGRQGSLWCAWLPDL